MSDDVAATAALDGAGKALVAWTARGYDEGMSPSMLRVASFNGRAWSSPQTDETRLFLTISDPPVESPDDPDGEPIWE